MSRTCIGVFSGYHKTTLKKVEFKPQNNSTPSYPSPPFHPFPTVTALPFPHPVLSSCCPCHTFLFRMPLFLSCILTIRHPNDLLPRRQRLFMGPEMYRPNRQQIQTRLQYPRRPSHLAEKICWRNECGQCSHRSYLGDRFYCHCL